MFVAFLLNYFHVPLTSTIGYIACAIAVVLEVMFFISYITWLIEKTNIPKDTPVLSYRSFRRIAQVAPDNWKPSDTRSACVLYYHPERDGLRRGWSEVRMESYLDMLQLYFEYERPYHKKQKMKERNDAMKIYLTLWQDDVDRYKERAREEAMELMKGTPGRHRSGNEVYREVYGRPEPPKWR